MIISYSNVIKVSEPTDEFKNWVRCLVLPNPEYTKKLRMGFWIGGTPPTLQLFEKVGNDYILPFGCFREVANRFWDAIYIPEFKPTKVIDYNANVPLYDYQEEAVEQMIDKKNGILQSPTGSGKGLPLNAKIYTPKGFTRNGDLKLGDKVLNTYGGWSTVTAIYDRGKQPCFEITFTDDTKIKCDSSHLWRVRNVSRSEWEIISTYDLFHKGWLKDNNELKYEIPIAEPVVFESRTVTINPWLLGAILGDGSISSNALGFSNSESDIVERFNSLVPLVYKNKHDYYVRDNGLLKYRLLDYGLFGKRSDEKFIPKDYLFNSIDVRLQVLQGLMDTDGSVKKSSTTISTTSRQLADDILFIVQSLGGTGKISERQTYYSYNGEKRKGKLSYRVYFKLYRFKPFTSEKHLRHHTDRTKYVKAYRRIKTIRPIAPTVTRCITVNSRNHLYLTDNFVATHNTQMGVALFSRLRTRTLWLCHTLDLVKQSMDRASQYIDKSLIGTIKEGKVDIGEGVTFATVQTMAHLDLPRYKHMWDVIIVDECHKVGTSASSVTQYQKVLNNLSARHKYGLSATVHRADGLIEATYALLGGIAYTVPTEAVADKIMKVGIKRVDTGIIIGRKALNTDGTLNYTKLINYLAEKSERNELIIDELIKNAERSCIILSDRVGHLDTLIDMLPPFMKPYAVKIDGTMTSKKGKAEREQALEDMRTGEKKYLFASYSLAKEGLDIPCLERLFMVTPIKDYAKVVQSVGRIARTHENKAEPICYDFVDHFGYADRLWKSRCRHYKKANCYFVEEK